MKSKVHDDAMAELYLDDPEFALEIINSIFEDGDQADLLIVLRQMFKLDRHQMKSIDTKIRHVTKPGSNLFKEFGFEHTLARQFHEQSKRQIIAMRIMAELNQTLVMVANDS